MPVINQNTPVANVQVPIPTPVQTQPKQATASAPIQAPQRLKPIRRPLTFGGEHDEFGNRVQGVSAVILPWSPQNKKLSRKRVVVRYIRPTLTEPQKVRAKKVELVVLPKDIDGKRCGTCKYAKKHSQDSIGLYCTNNAVHMNVKANWGCKLWDAKGVKRLTRKVVRYSERPMTNGPGGAGPEEEPEEQKLPDWNPQPEHLNGKLVEGVLRPMKSRGASAGLIDRQALGALGDHLQEIGSPLGEMISKHANGRGTTRQPYRISSDTLHHIRSEDHTHQIIAAEANDREGNPLTWVSISHWKKIPLPGGHTRLDKVKSYQFSLPRK